MTPARVVIQSWDGIIPKESFSPGKERLQGSPSVLALNGSRGVSPGGTTPGESFSPGMENVRGSNSVLVKRLQGSPSVMGSKDPMGVILS